MHDITTMMLELFGISGVPETFSEFIWCALRLLTGLSFIRFVVAMPFSFIRKLNERR